MTVTIELKPDIERRLREKAEEKGLTIEAYIVALIEEHLKETEILAITPQEVLADTN